MKGLPASETNSAAVIHGPGNPSSPDTGADAVAPEFRDPGLPLSPVASPEFRDLYREHFAFVWRTLRALGVTPSGLEDAVQDVFLVVLRQLEGFEQRATARTWIFSIAYNVASNYRRREGRKGGLLPLDPATAATTPDPESQLSSAQAWAYVSQFLDTLDEGKRAVFVLVLLEGMTAPEVAACLRIPVNTVYTRLHHARGAFREALAARDAGVLR